jgi:peptidoglycan/LPS O-acetylase OafA/YrhL
MVTVLMASSHRPVDCSMKDSPNLDLLRSLAVGLVVVSHLVLLIGAAGEAHVYSVKVMGRLGVMIFFVHTTLVLMLSLERHGSRAVTFFVRRFFRIFPLAAATVLLIAFFRLLVHQPVDRMQLLANLLLIQNITGHASTPDPLWSLPFEVQMYLALPALYAVTRLANRVLWVSLLCATALALAVLAWAAGVGIGPLVYVPCFLPGILGFVLWRGSEGWRSPLWLFALAAAAIAAVPALVAAGWPELPLCYGLCAALGLVIPRCRQITSDVLVRGAKTVAKYSYGIYLTHVFSTLLAFSSHQSGPAQWALFAVLLPGSAWIAYHAIEAPGIRMGIRITRAWMARAPVATVSAAPQYGFRRNHSPPRT